MKFKFVNDLNNKKERYTYGVIFVSEKKKKNMNLD